MLDEQKIKNQPKKKTEFPKNAAVKDIKNPFGDTVRNEKSKVKGLDRQEMIAIAAYYRAESRGFICGNEIQDWLWAEKEIDSRL